MTRRYTRRQFLGAGAAGLVGVSGCTAPLDSGARPNETERRTRESAVADREEPEESPSNGLDPVDVRGALYVPSRAWNTYQMWADYDEAEIERDLGYAERLNLNAIRTWVSYERWREDPDALEREIDHFLTAAEDRGMRAVLGLFESVGKEPTEDNLTNTDPWNAPPVQSPSSPVMRNEDEWDGPREFVRWFMDRHRDDDRLLAVEVMNEPGWLPDMKRFAAGMFETLGEERGSIPLTVGSTSMANNAEYVDWGCDILQFHYNFPDEASLYHDLLSEANQLSADLGMPAWLTEWQRIADFGWGGRDTVDEWQPDYASLAPVIHEHQTGNFFWSLMVKPAYVRYMRKRGVINGIFHEDGTVWNRADARAIKAMSGDGEVEVEQRREWPEWAAKVERRAFEGNE